jgi:hypothetical protein
MGNGECGRPESEIDFEHWTTYSMDKVCKQVFQAIGTVIDKKSRSISQNTVEKKLNKFAREVREGKRRSTVTSTRTVDSLSSDQRRGWYTIRKELEDIGITVDAFNKNKQFIFEWLENALHNGTFEEHCPNDSPTTTLHPGLSGELQNSNDSLRVVYS